MRTRFEVLPGRIIGALGGRADAAVIHRRHAEAAMEQFAEMRRSGKPRL